MFSEHLFFRSCSCIIFFSEAASFHQSVCSTGASILPLCTRRVVNTSLRGQIMLCLFIFRCTRSKKKMKLRKSCTYYIYSIYKDVYLSFQSGSVSPYHCLFSRLKRPVGAFHACRRWWAAPGTVPNPRLYAPYTRAPCPSQGRRDCKTQKGLNLSEPSSTQRNQSWSRFITE